MRGGGGYYGVCLGTITHLGGKWRVALGGKASLSCHKMVRKRYASQNTSYLVLKMMPYFLLLLSAP